jgi:putative ABC transport system ATP-binding protein
MATIVKPDATESAPIPSKPDALIVVRDIVKNYVMGEALVRALRGVSFEVARGSYVAIMGPSGSGKTTLMDIMGCLSRPTSGSYWLEGREVSGLNDNQLAQVRNELVGFVFQNFNLLPRATALHNVELPLLYEGMGRRDRLARAREALEAVGLGDRTDHRPSELSGGQRQRVAIARALVNNPSIVFADEPTGNLDSQSGTSILKLFQDLNERGNTIVMVTHEREVAEHAERIMSFRDGELVRDEWRENGVWAPS